MGASEKQAEIAVKHDISPGTLSELIQLFIDGKPETEEQKQLKEKIARIEKEKDMVLKELGKKQPEIELQKKRGFPGPAWKIIDPDLKNKNGCKVTIPEQCRILEIRKHLKHMGFRQSSTRTAARSIQALPLLNC